MKPARAKAAAGVRPLTSYFQRLPSSAGKENASRTGPASGESGESRPELSSAQGSSQGGPLAAPAEPGGGGDAGRDGLSRDAGAPAHDARTGYPDDGDAVVQCSLPAERPVGGLFEPHEEPDGAADGSDMALDPHDQPLVLDGRLSEIASESSSSAEDNDSQEEEDLPDLGALFGPSRFDDFSARRRHESRATRNPAPLYTGFPEPVDVGGALQSPVVRNTSTSYDLASLLKERKAAERRQEKLRQSAESVSGGDDAPAGFSDPPSPRDLSADPGRAVADSSVAARQMLGTLSLFDQDYVLPKQTGRPSQMASPSPARRLSSKRTRISALADRVRLGHVLRRKEKAMVCDSVRSQSVDSMEVQRLAAEVLIEHLRGRKENLSRSLLEGAWGDRLLEAAVLDDGTGDPDGATARPSLPQRFEHRWSAHVQELLAASVAGYESAGSVAADRSRAAALLVAGSLDYRLAPTTVLSSSTALRRLMLVSPVDDLERSSLAAKLNAFCAKTAAEPILVLRRLHSSLDSVRQVKALFSQSAMGHDGAATIADAIRDLANQALADSPAEAGSGADRYRRLAAAIELAFHAIGSVASVRGGAMELGTLLETVKGAYRRINDSSGAHLARTEAKHIMVNFRIWIENSSGPADPTEGSNAVAPPRQTSLLRYLS
ncbi:hypothetical protein DFJ74DRAFT_663268 [Hyaloraphidium curvatum]|nr:hypothetical protein DFJ74DRAFT_663268 [Hyaloraphidium curvatum]